MLQCFVCSPIPKVSEKKWATGQSFIGKEITSYIIGTLGEFLLLNGYIFNLIFTSIFQSRTYWRRILINSDILLNTDPPSSTLTFIVLSPSIRDRVQWKKNLALKQPVFSTFSNFFKKKKIIKAILCNFSMRLLKCF